MILDPSICPLCGGPNGCSMAASACSAGPCWCTDEIFPDGLKEKVPCASRQKACICRRCVVEARRAEAKARPLPEPQAGDFYRDGDLVVFTEAYHRRRGYCCGNDCRHCPFDAFERELSGALKNRKK